jgi:uncharacterized cupin superfamily protein
MERHTGVFVSKADTEEWEADPEVPGSDVHVFVDADGVQAGLTRFLKADAPVPWTSSAREVFMVLEGSVRIEVEGGPDLELGVGDMASLPEGLATMWHVSAPFKEIWVIA